MRCQEISHRLIWQHTFLLSEVWAVAPPTHIRGIPFRLPRYCSRVVYTAAAADVHTAGRSDVEQICDNNEMPVTNVFSTQFDRSALRLLIRVHHSSSSRRKQCVNVQPGLKSTRRETNEISASIDIGSSTPSDIVVVHTSHLCRPSCIRSSSLLLYIYIYDIKLERRQQQQPMGGYGAIAYISSCLRMAMIYRRRNSSGRTVNPFGDHSSPENTKHLITRLSFPICVAYYTHTVVHRQGNGGGSLFHPV